MLDIDILINFNVGFNSAPNRKRADSTTIDSVVYSNIRHNIYNIIYSDNLDIHSSLRAVIYGS